MKISCLIICNYEANPWVDPFTGCNPATTNNDVADMWLHVTMDGNTETLERWSMLEKALYARTNDVLKSIDYSIHIPLNVTSGTLE